MSEAINAAAENGTCTFTFVDPPGAWTLTTDNCSNGAHCSEPGNSIPPAGLTTEEVVKRVDAYNAHVTAAELDLPLIVVPRSPANNQIVTWTCV